MIILAIDPGTVESGWCEYCDGSVIDSGVFDNGDMLEKVANSFADILAIEMMASLGMAVGKEVFETVRWTGRFQQAWRDPDAVKLVYRSEVKMHLCGSMRAKDGNIRQAIIDLFPATGGGKVRQIGTSKAKGPLYGVASHAWPALGVALTVIGKTSA